MSKVIHRKYWAAFLPLGALLVSVAHAVCTYTLSTSSRIHGNGATNNTVAVTAGADCAWSVVNTNPWITITSATVQTNSGTVAYSVSANPAITSRTGLVSIADKVFTLTQSGALCSYVIAPGGRAHGHGATVNTVSLTTSNGCVWSVVNTNSWITITSGLNRTNSGIVSYSVAANPAALVRAGNVRIGDQVFALSQSNAPCVYAITPNNRPHGHGAATNTVSLTTLTGCVWTVANTNPWITITSGTNRTNGAIVSYRVTANPTAFDRTGVVIIADQLFTLTQGGAPCDYSISPTNRPHGNSAATNTVAMATVTGCAWTVTNNNPWVTILTGTNYTNSGTVTYTVAANPSGLGRTGLVFFADQVLTLSQAGALCNYSLAPTNSSLGGGTETATVAVTTITGCNWSAGSSSSWITFPLGTNGTGNGSLTYVVAANPSGITSRTGTVVVAGQQFKVRQTPGTCSFTLSPASGSHISAVKTGVVAVTTLSGCRWSVVNTNPWITLITGTNVTNSANVRYRVAANASAFSRTGLLSIASQDYTVVQFGVGCSYSVSPANRPHGYAAATNTFSVNTASNCTWSVLNTNHWISILLGGSGAGSNAVTYAVAANTTIYVRTGVVVVAGDTITIQQQGIPCEFSLMPPMTLHGRGATTNTFNVKATPSCAWSVVNTNPWLTILSATNFVGSNAVTYAVAFNPFVQSRTGFVAAADQLFLVRQSASPCDFDLTPGDRNHGQGATTNTVTLTTSNSCVWSVLSTNSWVTIVSATNQTNSGIVTYRVTPNPTSQARTSFVAIADQIFVLSQDGTPCAYDLSTGQRTHGQGAATNKVTVATVTGCVWSVINTNPWITITSGADYTNSADVAYTVLPNPGALERTGVVAIAGQPFTVNQEARPCTFSISPDGRSHGHGATSNTVSVTASNGCSWVTVNTNTWITILSGSSGSGAGLVSYAVADNAGINDRAGVVTIDGQSFTVTQRGITCAVSVSPVNRPHGNSEATNHLSVVAGASCSWIVVNTNPWITMLSATSGVGSTNVDYVILANSNAAPRIGVVTVDDETFTITQAGSSCNFTIAPTSRLHGTPAGSNTFGVTTAEGCKWTVTNLNDWITITSDTNGTNTGSVTYMVAANPDQSDRTGLVFIASETFTVTQRGATNCLAVISPPTRAHGYGAATNSVSVIDGGDCVWSVVNTSSWVTITSGLTGTGSASVSYTVEASPVESPRTAVVLIAGEAFSVTQSGFECAYSLSPPTRMHGYSGSPNTVAVITSSNCAWTVLNTNAWVTLNSGGSGTGTGLVAYTVGANPGLAARTGLVWIADQMFTITQPGLECAFALSPADRMHGYSGSPNTVAVTTTSNCAWTVLNSNSWVTINSGASGLGTGLVAYAVGANPGLAARTGLVWIADQVFTITQPGFDCAFKISPTNRPHGFAAATNSVTMTTTTNCAWSVVNPHGWITITSGAGGTGNGIISYIVAPNFTPLMRTGVVTIGEEALVITQRGATNGFSFETISTPDPGQVKLRLSGAPAGVWELQGSLDLEHWSKIADLTNFTGVVEYLDTGATNVNRRFYRAVLP